MIKIRGSPHATRGSVNSENEEVSVTDDLIITSVDGSGEQGSDDTPRPAANVTSNDGPVSWGRR